MSLTLTQKTRFYQQLYMGFKAGLPMDMLVQNVMLSDSKPGRSASLNADIQKGKPLSSALLARKLISNWEARLLSVGEGSGQLETVLLDLQSYYESRSNQFRNIKSQLRYPLILLFFAVIVPPLPQVVAGSLSLIEFVLSTASKTALMLVFYYYLIVLPFEKASNGAFNPVLLRMLKYVGASSKLREMFEISYLNLLTICLESGLSAAETLRLLKEGSNNRNFNSGHQGATRLIENHGSSLSKALRDSNIIQNHENLSFLSMSEASGTLHSELRKFVVRKKTLLAADIDFQVKRLCKWFYLLTILYSVSRF